MNINQKRLLKEYDTSAFRKERARLLEDKSVNNERYRAGFERFKKEFEVPQELFDLLWAKAKEEHIEYTDSMYQATLPVLRLQLKAMVARDIFSISEYVELMLPFNTIILKGIEAIKDEELFKDIKKQ